MFYAVMVVLVHVLHDASFGRLILRGCFCHRRCSPMVYSALLYLLLNAYVVISIKT